MTTAGASESGRGNERLAYSAKEVAELLSIGLTSAKALIRSGELRSVKILRCRRVPVEALHEYMRQLDSEQNDAASICRSGYDSGGLLSPGVTLAVNRTGKPERVLGPTEPEPS